jgi:2-oxoglutarate dehydrogenase E2 component (dihydrolipoamide succinyltransferase)
LLSPVVRRLVNEHNLSVDSISGTGPGGRITREDVLDHIDKIANGSVPAAPVAAASAPRPAAASPAPVVSAPSAAAPIVRAGERDDVVPLSKIRQLTGAHMTMSLSVSPHAFSVVEVDYANVDNTRAKTNSNRPKVSASRTFPLFREQLLMHWQISRI